MDLPEPKVFNKCWSIASFLRKQLKRVMVCKLVDIKYLEISKGGHMSNITRDRHFLVHGKQMAALQDHIDKYEVHKRRAILSFLSLNHPHPCVFVRWIANIGEPLNKGNLITNAFDCEGEKDMKLCHWEAVRPRYKSYPDKYCVIMRELFPVWCHCVYEFLHISCSPTMVAWCKIHRCCSGNHWHFGICVVHLTLDNYGFLI